MKFRTLAAVATLAFLSACGPKESEQTSAPVNDTTAPATTATINIDSLKNAVKTATLDSISRAKDSLAFNTAAVDSLKVAANDSLAAPAVDSLAVVRTDSTAVTVVSDTTKAAADTGAVVKAPVAADSIKTVAPPVRAP